VQEYNKWVQELIGQDWPVYFAPIPEGMDMYACCADRYNTIMRRRIKTVSDQRPVLVYRPLVDDETGQTIDPVHKRNTRSKDGGKERVRYSGQQGVFDKGDYFDGDISLLGFEGGEPSGVDRVATAGPSSAVETNHSDTTCIKEDGARASSCSSSFSGRENLSIPKSYTPPPIDPEEEVRQPMYHSRVLSEFPSESVKGL
jgi:hypothetical protein